MSGVAVAGVGNAYRRDDGAGVAFAALFAAEVAEVRDLGPIAEPLDLVGRLDGVDTLVLADAARTGAGAGRVLVCELTLDEAGYGLPGRADAAAATSTHGIGLERALALAAVLGRAPRRVVLVAIEGESFGDGDGLSAAVAAGISSAIPRVRRLIGGRPGV